MRKKLLFCAAIVLFPMHLYALEASEQTESVNATSVVTDTTIEIKNNSIFAVYVIQKGLKQELLPKATVQLQNYSTQPISVTPVSKTDTIKYVTLTGKVGACQAVTCLIVQ